MGMKTLQMKRAIHVALLFLLLGVVGIGKAQTGNITFADANVKALCVANWDTNGDGELSYDEAAAVTDLGTVFYYKRNITSFNELQYFTGLTTIGEYAFTLSSITSIQIPNSVIAIEYQAFIHCQGLSSITFGNSLIQIDEEAFYHCGLTGTLCFPPSLTTIGWNAFGDCENITALLIGKTINSIDDAFVGNTSLEQIIVDTENTTYDSRNNCNAIIKTSSNQLILGCKNTVIPNTVTSIGMGAFNGCRGLSSIIIPNSIRRIEQLAFQQCTSLTSITIPNSVTNIDFSAFSGCFGLEEINVASDNTAYDSRDNCNAIIRTGTNSLVSGCKNTVIPNSVTKIGLYAFAGCTNLTSIVIPVSVTTIETLAFSDCTSLTAITVFAEAPPSLGSYAFEGVNKSIPVYVPSGKVAAYQAAEGWSEFTNFIDYGSPITFADANVKALCVANWDTNGDGELSYAEAAAVTDLGEVFKSNNTITSFNELQHFTGLTSIGSQAFFSCVDLTSVIIPNTVSSIGGYAFDYCSSLTSIEIPNSVTSIGTYAFTRCSGLEQIIVDLGNTVFDSRNNCNAVIMSNTNKLVIGCKNSIIPNSITSIGTYAFLGCIGLTSITIPFSVTEIEWGAFVDTGLTSIVIPSSVTSIGGDGAFSGGIGLEQIIVDPENTVYDSRNNCNAIIETNTNKLVTGCKNTVIPNTVTSIGYAAFHSCSGLISLEIPNSVTSMGNYAFYDCSGLSSMTVLADNPPTLGIYMFYNVNKSIPVYVPTGTMSAYQAAFGWSEFTNIQGLDNSPNPITFADTNVKALCVANWDTNGDGELSYAEAAAVTDLGEVFKNKYSIISCNELQYFTGLSLIGNNAFYSCLGLTSIEIPNSVTSIGDQAFSNCRGITSIAIPNSVTSINYEAFYGVGLTSLAIPNSVTSIGNEAFKECQGLTLIEIPNSVTSIGTNPFGKCYNLEHITVASGNSFYDSRDNCNAVIRTNTNELIIGCKNTVIPNSVTSIGNEAFYYCSGLTSIAIPNSVTSIGRLAFCDTGLTSIEIPSSVTTIGYQNPFAGCSGLEHIVVDSGNVVYDSRDNCNAIINTSTNTLVSGCKNTIIPNVVTTIGSYAFSGCDDLTSIEIPYAVTYIRDNAFRSCHSLTSIVIPSLVSSIGIGAFHYCSGLSSMTVLTDNPPIVNIYGGVAFYGVNKSIPVYVPSGTVAAYQAAEGWSEFTNYIDYGSPITFADANVKALCVANWDTNGDGELSYAEAAAVTDLGEVFMADSVITCFNELQYFTGLTSVRWYAFANCHNLSALTLPNSVMSIGDGAFGTCKNLSSLTIPNSVTSIGDFAFEFCHGLTSMTIPISVTSLGYGLFYCCSPLSQIVVEAGNPVYDSRENCNAIIETSTNTLVAGCKNTTIPSSVTSIGQNAFDGSGLTSLDIPNSVTSIGDFAFSYCLNLTSITIPSSVTFIGNYAFSQSGLTSITIPNSIAHIGNWAFSGCGSLGQIVVDPGNTVYDSRENCNAIIETSSNKLIVGGNNTTIPNSVTSIGPSAFRFCSGLTSIEIPNSVTSIESSAFGGCTGLISITSFTETPPTIGSNAFSQVDKTIPVYVLIGTVAAYQAAEGWNEFTNYIEMCPGIITVSTTPEDGGSVTGGGSYEGGAVCTLLAIPNEGYSFLNWTENGVVVSNDAEYFFRVYGDRGLMANFAETVLVYEGSVTNNYVPVYGVYADVYEKCEMVYPASELSDMVGGNLIRLTYYISSPAAAPWTSTWQVFLTEVDNTTINTFTGTNDAIVVYEGTLDGTGAVMTINFATPYHYNGGNLLVGIYNITSGGNWKACKFFGEIVEGASVLGISTNSLDAVNPTQRNFLPKTLFSYNTIGPIPTNTIIVSANPVESGNISGAGVYNQSSMCTLNATANEGFVFNNWTENDVEVSSDAVYSFKITRDRNLVANFFTNHWNPESAAYSETMAMNTVIQIDGVEQYSNMLEVGVFCGEECRGSAIAAEFPLTHRYLAIPTVYGQFGHQLAFKLYDHSIGQELNLTSPSAVTFNEDGYGTPVEPYILNFTSTVDITATVDPNGAGMVTGTGEYAIGTTCTLTASANEGYQFKNWTLNSVEVSTNATYQFTVTEDASYVAHFQKVHTQALVAGWSWWSTYIEQDGIDGLGMLENSIGSAGVRIQGRNGNVDQFDYQGTSYWYGTLTTIANEQMYKIRTNAACNAVIVGDGALLSSHPITIANGWNWIGFPSGQSVNVDVAMSGFTPEANDVIKGRNGTTTFVTYGNSSMWYGTLNALEPGQGYMYKSNSGSNKTLTFQNCRGEEIAAATSYEGTFFTPNKANFADNMLLTAVLEMDGKELRSEDYEVAAFVGNECRGSVRLMYVEPFDRYVAFLLVFGDVEEEINFALTDGNGTVLSSDHVTYSVDGTIGTLTEPETLHFGSLGLDDSETEVVNIFPNPSDGVFNIEGNGIRKIEVVDIYGQVVFSKENENTTIKIDLSGKTAGLYLLRVVTDNGIMTKQLIKNKN